MTVTDTEFARLLLKQIDEEARTVIQKLSSGLLELEGYKFACGELRAYQRVEEMCKEVEKLMREGN